MKRLLGTGLLLILFCQLLFSQTLPDFSSMNVSELTDQQVESLVRRAGAMGYSQADLFDLARQNGLSASDISLLGERINKASAARMVKSSSSPIDNPRLREAYYDSLQSTAKRETDIFGLTFFRKNSEFLTFTPSLNIPTPKDYSLVPGDEIFIDIYGSSEQYYEATVNPDGNVLLENLGPVSLQGLTLDQAEDKLKRKFVPFYTELGGNAPKTFLDVSLGQTSPIQVNMVGEVELPGTYTLSAFSTVFNALYVAGGITEQGTLREIRVVRNGKILSSVDVYGFLVNGNTDSNTRLKNDDVIIVGPYTNRVSIKGAVKIPGRFELKESENLGDLLRYAGGFSENASSDQVSVVRNLNGEKVVADVFQSQYPVFSPKAGDSYNVKEVLNRFTNRVQIQGAIFRPGDYSITGGLTVKELISKAQGLKGDANLSRAIILRSKPDLTTETVSFDLGALMNDGIGDIPLQREDVVKIFSIYDLGEERYLEISGQVNKPGVFGYSSNMTVEDLIAMAGGFQSSATASRIEITRRYGNAEEGSIAEIIQLDVDKDLKLSSSDGQTTLQPFDHVVVRKSPDFFTQKFVQVDGQVKYPGSYAITSQNERISSLVERAGGINKKYAYVEGATLLRKTEFYTEKTDVEQKITDLQGLLQRYESGDSSLTESQLAQITRLKDELESYKNTSGENQSLATLAKRERLREIVQRNSLFQDVKMNESDNIGIDLISILENPGSKEDLVLEEEDVLIIPKKPETVKLRGRVLYPTTVVFEDSQSFRNYIGQAGGFDSRAKRKGSYVIYANGSVAKTRHFLFFKSYPNVEPGAEIIVPAKAPKLPVSVGEIVGITSGLATLALLISQINF